MNLIYLDLVSSITLMVGCYLVIPLKSINAKPLYILIIITINILVREIYNKFILLMIKGEKYIKPRHSKGEFYNSRGVILYFIYKVIIIKMEEIISTLGFDFDDNTYRKLYKI